MAQMYCRGRTNCDIVGRIFRKVYVGEGLLLD